MPSPRTLALVPGGPVRGSSRRPVSCPTEGVNPPCQEVNARRSRARRKDRMVRSCRMPCTGPQCTAMSRPGPGRDPRTTVGLRGLRALPMASPVINANVPLEIGRGDVLHSEAMVEFSDQRASVTPTARWTAVPGTRASRFARSQRILTIRSWIDSSSGAGALRATRSAWSASIGVPTAPLATPTRRSFPPAPPGSGCGPRGRLWPRRGT